MNDSEKMKNFAISYFNASGIDSRNFDYIFNEKTGALEIRRENKLLYSIDRHADEESETYIYTISNISHITTDENQKENRINNEKNEDL